MMMYGGMEVYIHKLGYKMHKYNRPRVIMRNHRYTNIFMFPLLSYTLQKHHFNRIKHYVLCGGNVTIRN